jgi:uncharacterized protein (DUF58 family)
VQQFSVLSFLLLLLLNYSYFTREIEHKIEVLSPATAILKNNFARKNTSMVESEDIKHSHLAFF